MCIMIHLVYLQTIVSCDIAFSLYLFTGATSKENDLAGNYFTSNKTRASLEGVSLSRKAEYLYS